MIGPNERFVVISADLLWEDVAYAQRFGFHFGDLYIEQLTWMQDHLEELLSKTVPGVTCSWEHLGLGSHSAGADSTLYMVARNHTLYQAHADAIMAVENFSSYALDPYIRISHLGQ
nr:hypothetical protein BaRGS_030274 [Batillaria attramentaria]